ncbi:MAG TPA: hypothetical protein PKC69_00570 [Chitinophagaceae bacterium]|nr:hypothetical protein [Chitinophagaceae bacterium]
MRMLFFSMLAVFSGYAGAQPAVSAAEAINYDDYKKLVKEVGKYRKQWLVTPVTFLAMDKEEGVVIPDTQTPCRYQSRHCLNQPLSADTADVRLGKSNFYIALPNTFKVSEARGKEGQPGYHISPADESKEWSLFIEIKRGSPIMSSKPNWGKEIEKIQSCLLGKPIVWTVYQASNNFYIAMTPKEEVNAKVSAKKREDIPRLIAIAAKLKKNQHEPDNSNLSFP